MSDKLMESIARIKGLTEAKLDEGISKIYIPVIEGGIELDVLGDGVKLMTFSGGTSKSTFKKRDFDSWNFYYNGRISLLKDLEKECSKFESAIINLMNKYGLK